MVRNQLVVNLQNIGSILIVVCVKFGERISRRSSINDKQGAAQIYKGEIIPTPYTVMFSR